MFARDELCTPIHDARPVTPSQNLVGLLFDPGEQQALVFKEEFIDPKSELGGINPHVAQMRIPVVPPGVSIQEYGTTTVIPVKLQVHNCLFVRNITTQEGVMIPVNAWRSLRYQVVATFREVPGTRRLVADGPFRLGIYEVMINSDTPGIFFAVLPFPATQDPKRLRDLACFDIRVQKDGGTSLQRCEVRH